MSQDMAQIARNTLGGRIFQTNYVTPIGYHFFPDVHQHPDFLRYPLTTGLYVLLFSVFPASGATIKLFNALLFVVNGFLVARLARALLVSRWPAPQTSLRIDLVAWTAALAASALVFSYFRHALTSQTSEILATTLLLAILLGLVKRIHPAGLGVLCALLYLSRPDMGILGFVVAAYLWVQPAAPRSRLGSLAWLAGGLALALVPACARSLYHTGEPFFGLGSQTVAHGTLTAGYNELLRSFDAPGSLLGVAIDQWPLVLAKVRGNLASGLPQAFERSYWAAWIGCPLLFWLVPGSRRPLTALAAFWALHMLALCFLVQLPRLHIPTHFALSALGFTGLAVAAAYTRLDRAQSPLRPGRAIARSAAIAALGLSAIALGVRPVRDSANLRPPSEGAVRALEAHRVSCAYTNNPWWIAWYADTIAFYYPYRFVETRAEGPSECRYFMFDTRRSLEDEAEIYLRTRADRVADGRGFALFRLRDG